MMSEKNRYPYFGLRQSPVDSKWRAWLEIPLPDAEEGETVEIKQVCVAVADTKAKALAAAQSWWERGNE
jgi:uncharacterized protein (DUF1684 family)